MKDSPLTKVFGDSLQRQMNQDMADMCSEMSAKNTHNRNIKVTPAYEHIDVFQRQQIESSIRMRNEKRQATTGIMVHPDDPGKPKVMVVLPNE